MNTRGKYGAATGSHTLDQSSLDHLMSKEWLSGKQNANLPHAERKFTFPTTKGSNCEWEHPYFISRKSLSNRQTSLFILWGFNNKLYYETGNKTIGRSYFTWVRERRYEISLPFPWKIFQLSSAFALCKTQSPVRNSNLWAWQGHSGDQAAHLHILITINIYFFHLCRDVLHSYSKWQKLLAVIGPSPQWTRTECIAWHLLISRSCLSKHV